MREKPILFNTPMVRALLDGRKKATRRLIKPQPNPEWEFLGWCTEGKEKGYAGFGKEPISILFAKPKYIIGDRPWVQETWKIEAWDHDNKKMLVVYRADGQKTWVEFLDDRYAKFFKFISKNGWQSPYFMPREASRIFLEVTDVRVEKVQDITEEDALREGVPEEFPMDKIYCDHCNGTGLWGTNNRETLGYMDIDCPYCNTSRKRFANLWNSTISKKDLPIYGWEANPWLFVYTFKDVTP